MSNKAAVNQDLRNVIAQGAIAFMVCLGAFMFLVDPASKKLASARAQETMLLSQASAVEALRNSVPQISAAATRAREEAERIQQTGRLARQEQELFAALSSLAARSKIRVDQLTPNKVIGTNKLPGAGQSASSAPEQPESSLNAAFGYTIDATAPYSDLAAFLKAVRTELGYCLVKSVRISPTQDLNSNLVHAIIVTEHYSFDASPLAAAGPGSEGAH